MVKGAKGKSSASSATRKKHASKKGEPNDPSTSQPKTKKGKGKNKEPKVKVYIPPPKYQPLQPDPLDTYGLAGTLPADLVVVLRRLAKKDVTTRKRALDELLEWSAKGDEESVQGLGDMMPVWYHHLPNLLSHPARQLRLSALLVHHAFLKTAGVREALLRYLKDVASEDDQEKILGIWCMSAADADRQIAIAGRQCWDEAVSWTISDPSDPKVKLQFSRIAYLPAVSSFVEKILEDPLAMFAHLHPPTAPPSLPPAGKASAKHALAKPKEEASTRAKGELDEELDEDRIARLRSGALGALNWMLDTYPKQPEDRELLPPLNVLLASPVFWTHLSYAKVPPWMEKQADRQYQGYGHNQIVVRRGVWVILKALLTKWQDVLAPYVELMGTAILRSAWVEPDASVRAAMWEPLLSFLTKFPRSWEVDARPRANIEDDEDSSDESAVEDADDSAIDNNSPALLSDVSFSGQDGVLRSEAYEEFLNFLRTACRGSPTGGYPTVLVVLSTIPRSFVQLERDSLVVLFRAFWDAVEGKALIPSDVLSFRAFLSSVLESLVYLSGKTWRASESQRRDGSAEKSETADMSAADPGLLRDSATYIVAQQFERTSALLLGSSTLLADQETLRTIARTFLRLTQIDKSLFDAAWTPVSLRIRESGHAVVASKALAALWSQLRGGACESDIRLFILEYGGSALSSIDWDVSMDNHSPSVETVIAILQLFGELLSSDMAFSQSLSAILHEKFTALLSGFPPKQVADLFTAYLTRQAHAAEADHMWQALLLTIGSPMEETNMYIGLPVLSYISEALEEGTLPVPLHPLGGELARLGDDLLAGRIAADGREKLLGSLLRHHDRFFNQETTFALLASHSSSLRQEVEDALRKSSHSLAPLIRLLHILDGIPARVFDDYLSLYEDVGTRLYSLAFILPLCPLGSTDANIPRLARSILSRWITTCSELQKDKLRSGIDAAVQELVLDAEVQAGARESVRAYVGSILMLEGASTSFGPVQLFSQSKLQEEFNKLLHAGFASVLSGTNLLVPAESETSSKSSVFDAGGFSTYARLVSGLLEALTGGRPLALPAEHVWTVPHLLAFAIFARDLLEEPAATNAVFRSDADTDELLQFLAVVDKVIPYTFSATVGELSADWHSSCISFLRKPADAERPQDSVIAVLSEVYRASLNENSVLSQRILNALLVHVVRRSTAADLERWLALAQTVQDKSGGTCMAIVLSIKGSLGESPRLNRYQNELASRLSAVPPSRADRDGLPLLRLLIAVAPPPDSLAPFLPPQRGIFLVQALQKWVVSDEDLDEEIDRRLGELFEYLAPIVEDIPGGHWDLIFDLLENNLETCASDDNEDLPLLYGSLRLLTTIRDLAGSVSVLREAWSEREGPTMQLVRRLFLSEVRVKTRSKLRQLCRSLIVDLAQELPQSLVDEDTMQKLYGLLYDSSVDIQKTAHKLLQRTIPKVTEQRVVEAAVNVTSTLEDDDAIPQPPQFSLPPELLGLILQHADDVYEEDTQDAEVFGHLLGWMTLLDFFVDASPALKTYYVEQLRSGDVLSRSLFPAILPLLPVGKEGRPLAINLFNVEEFYVEYFDADDPQSISVLAAHLFYRTLSTIPSLVRVWWLDIKDRQLSSSLAAFTSTHFTPILVSAELAKLRLPSAEEELAHESLSIKIASNVSEVTVAYVVDEQQMELGIRLPPDFPLHGVEVRDVKRVGVPLDKWRQWMLQVQQTITSQNGFLLDALVLFKKNVTLYFEGVVECAICYSVISTTDRSLPTKPCKTCKNLFHNSCLYKWFNTSNQSSCPLCRSQF